MCGFVTGAFLIVVAYVDLNIDLWRSKLDFTLNTIGVLPRLIQNPPNDRCLLQTSLRRPTRYC